MGDLIGELLGWILGEILEALFGFLLGAVLDLLLRAVREVFNTTEIESPGLARLGYVLLGGLSGGLSVFLFPHRIIHNPRMPGFSLVVSPVIVGLLMALTGSILRRRNKRVTRIESFGYGLAFGLGMALIRFWFVK